MLYNFRAASFPSGEVTEQVDKLFSKSFIRRSVCASCACSAFIYAVSRQSLYRDSKVTDVVDYTAMQSYVF